MKDILLLRPHLEYQMWGSNHLRKDNIDLNGANDVGEAWVISAYPGKSSIIINGQFNNMKLSDVFRNHRELFDNYKEDKYPLICKYIDCNENLDIMVHPKDEYAQKHFQELGGRDKIYYVIRAKSGADIVIGHKAKTLDEFKKLIKEEKWDELLIHKELKEGDVFYIPSGTVHGINEGSILYSVQCSSKPALRLYNYNRHLLDEAYKLNTNEALENIIIPYIEPSFKPKNDVLVDTKKFKLLKIKNNGIKEYSFDDARWLQVSVINGSGVLNDKYDIKTGTSFIVPSTLKSFKVEGNVTMLISYVIKK